MAEKHTTLAQMRMSALRSKSEMLALLVSALEGVQVGMTITLPAESWAGRAQTIQNGSFLADSNYCYFVCPDADNYTEGSEAGIRADNVTVDGSMTFHCEVEPETDIVINIIRLEVENDEEDAI